VISVGVVMPLAEQRGGGELMLLQLVAHAPRSEVRWLVIFLESGPMVKQVADLGADVEVVEAGRLRALHRYIWAVWKIARILRKHRVVITCGWMAKGHLYSSMAAMLARVPAFWYQLGTADPSFWMDFAAAKLSTNGIIVLSRAGEKAQIELCPKTKVRLVYPGVDLHRFDAKRLVAPPEMRALLKLPTDGPLVGIAGRLQRWKGIHHLIEAMPYVLTRHPNSHCVVVGGEWELERDYAATLHATIRRLGLEETVILAGQQSNVHEWMQAMDVVVHASDNEPFGIVVIEAMALAKPVVASAEGGPREIITPGVNGLTAPFGDSQAIAARILSYLDEPGRAAAIGLAARDRAGEFGVEVYARRFLAAANEFITERAEAPI